MSSKRRGYPHLVTTWLPTELHLVLETYAKLRKTSKSDVVREALKEYFRLQGFTAADTYAVLLGSGSRKEVVMV